MSSHVDFTIQVPDPTRKITAKVLVIIGDQIAAAVRWPKDVKPTPEQMEYVDAITIQRVEELGIATARVGSQWYDGGIEQAGPDIKAFLSGSPFPEGVENV